MEMMRLLALLCASATLRLITGCTTVHTIQSDVSPERTITTTITARSFITGAQAIEKFKATTTDKTQSIGAQGVEQEAISANAVKFMESAERIAEKFTVKP
jgi:hypothetical protein